MELMVRRVRRIAVVAAIGLTVVFGAWVQGEARRGTEDAAAAETRMRDEIRYLASDDLEGRGVGLKGLDLAADFIRDQFEKSGLKTDIIEGTPFQPFEMKIGSKLGETNQLILRHPDKGEIVCELNSQFVPMSFGGSGKFAGEIAFCGYGIEDEKSGYNDFADIDLKGKIALIMRRNPQQGNPHGNFLGTSGGTSKHAALTTKVNHALNRGAVAVLFVDDPYSARDALKDLKSSLSTQREEIVESTREMLAIAETDADKLKTSRSELEAMLKREAETEQKVEAGEQDKLTDFGYGGHDPRSIPVLHLTRKLADELLETSLKTNLKGLEAKIDEDLKPQSQLLTGWTAEGHVTIIKNIAQVKNIIGVIEGETDETVVIGAHYDHVGRGGPNSLAPGSREIHNGADDNASGTVGLLELAHRFGLSGVKPKRRLVFIAFTGEEEGLIGSAHYVAHPIWPLEKTVAMINMDMIGRLHEEKLTIFGTGTSPIWDPMLDQLAEKYGFKLNKAPTGMGPSDQTSFYIKNIPVLHLFTGTHSDYHRPGDDWEKINVGGMVRVVDMIQEIVQQVLNADTRPEFVLVKAPAKEKPEGSRPYFGSIPEFGSDLPGYSISGAAPGSPAEKGGLKSGDRIIQIEESKIDSLEDFDLALRKFKPGQAIEVTVMRGKDEVKLKVTLETPR